jgi:glycosyltransferase involved in cell wall biosynthesis
MNILFCQPTLDRSGSEKSLFEILAGQREQDYGLFLLAGEDGPMREELLPLVECLFVVRAPKLRRRPAVLWPYVRSFWTVFAAVRRVKRDNEIGLAYVNTLMFPQAVVAAALNRLTCVVHIRETEAMYPKGRGYYRFCVGLSALLGKRIICVCDYIRTQRRLPFRGRFLRKSTVVFNSSGFVTGPIERSMPKTPRLLSVVATIQRKGIDDLVSFAIEIGRRGRTVDLRIVGRIVDTELHARVTKRLAEHTTPAAVSFCSETSDLRSEYENAHLLVHPSRGEALPRVLVEAANFSLPAVTTDAGGSREVVVDGETGFVVPVGDWKTMADRVEQLIDDPALYRSMAASTYERYQREFTRARLAERIRGVIERVP